jgi:hypothetical protein
MCKEMLVILVNWVVDMKRIIGKNGGWKRRGTRGRLPPPLKHHPIPRQDSISRSMTQQAETTPLDHAARIIAYLH